MSKQQRRKGNAKNASSAAAHGYLSQGGEVLVGLTPEMNIFEVASSNKMHQVSEIDDETRIVMKKLTKKDASTREKGLKELQELIRSEKTSAETCYEHFCGLVPQLSTDGAPTVRMLTMKTIALFLVKLKKAASKGLKKIIPMVLFAKSDVTNGVAAAAAAVIRDGFDADKKPQILQLFGPLAFEMAAGIALGKHELSLPIEYDALEDRESRKIRLETQSLNVFLSHIREFGSNPIWEEHAKKLFEAPEYIKKVFSGSRETVKVQLLTLCYRFSGSQSTDLLLGLAPILPYIQSTLDAQTFTQECGICWEGLILLIPNEKFQQKVSLAKGIVPRILNVIRKKGNHWRVLKHHFLPAVVALLDQLAAPDGGLKTLTSIMDSFTDNLPWPVDASLNAIHCWFHTFADFVRWILTNDRINQDILNTLIPLTVRMSEQAMLQNTGESTECVSELIFWLIEKVPVAESRTLVKLVEEKLIEVDGERSKLLRDALTSSGRLLNLCDLHVALLSRSELADFNVIRNLARAEPTYARTVLDGLQNFNFLVPTEKFDSQQSEEIVKLIRIILEVQKPLEIQVKNDHIGRHLLLSGDAEIWEKVLREVPESVFQEMSNYWHKERNGKANAQAVSFLKRMGINLNTTEATGDIEFIVSLLASADPSDPERHDLQLRLFASLFESEEEPKDEHFQKMASYMTVKWSSPFIDSLFKDHENFETDRILKLVERFDKLIGLCEEEPRKAIVGNQLTSLEEAQNLAKKLTFLEMEVLVAFNGSHLTDRPDWSIEAVDEEEAKRRLKVLGRKALFNIATIYHDEIHRRFGSLLIGFIDAYGWRYCLKPLDEELDHLRDELKKFVEKTGSPPEQIASSQNQTFTSNCVELIPPGFGGSVEVVETCRTVFLNTEVTPMQYVENVFNCNGIFEMFLFDASSENDWSANFYFVQKCIEANEGIFRTDNNELRDYTLCGLVTVLDRAVDCVRNEFENDARMEALAALYLRLFQTFSETVATVELEPQVTEEWNEYYAPTLISFVMKLFLSVRKDQQPTPFIRNLLEVILSIKTFPNLGTAAEDDGVAREFVPELAAFGYSPFIETCISQAFTLLASDREHIQLIGYSMARLLMPIMFYKENEKAMKAYEEETLQITGNRPKLVLPVMIEKCYPRHQSHHSHLGTLLLDLAILPLEYPHATFGQEQRVSYCDTINPFIKYALNELMIEQPFEFRTTPISCRIPKSEASKYYLESDLRATPAFFDKFAARLLFKTITLLPAAVRLFHKSMPICFAPMFQEAVTKYASRLLIDQELAKVRQATFGGGEMKVRTVPVTGEIIAEYIVEETKMKLTIGLPPDYPLSVPTMSLDKAIVKSDRAKKWLLQLNAYLFHQNGAILEGLEMWKRNVDKGVEGVEDCSICLMTVHQQTHQLPKVKCQQCKNKFHSNCLYKWFESSNQATCPLCRNNFT